MQLEKTRLREKDTKVSLIRFNSYVVKSKISIYVRYQLDGKIVQERAKENEEQSPLEDIALEEEEIRDEKIVNFENFIESKPKEKYIRKKGHHLDDKIIPYERLKNYSNSGGIRDSKSGAYVFYVPSFALPSGNGWRALGMYDPKTHSIYISNDLSGDEERFVYHHEVAHALGIYDEGLADNYASAKTGYSMRA